MSSPTDADLQVVHREPCMRPRRPVSYPWGPESRCDAPHVSDAADLLAKHNSDPTVAAATATTASRPKTQVKPFTKESLERLERKTVQLVREYGFQPRRKLSVEDGSRLPAKFEPFPAKLYGRPLEEIDNFIYDEVCDRIFKLFSSNWYRFQLF